MIGNLIAAIIIGIIAGYLGRALLPGDDSMGFLATVLVGIVGALVGWVLFAYVLGIGDNDKFDLGGIVGSILGTMVVLLILRAVGGSGARHQARSRRLTALNHVMASSSRTGSRPWRSRPCRSHTGTTPWRFHGRSTRLCAASSSALASTLRVSRGSITSSIMSLPAAM